MFKKTKEPTQLDKVIADLLKQMLTYDADHEDYPKMTKMLSELYKLKEIETPHKPVSPDTIALIAANLVGIILIINAEHVGIITSKALGFVSKLR